MTGHNLIIAVTGTPASGKSTFAKELSAEITNSKVIELNDVVDRFKLFSSIDKLGSKIVKIRELNTKMAEIIKVDRKDSHLIIVGHLVPELELGQDITVVLRVSLRDLIKRLEARHYQKEKIGENIISESIDYCGAKSREQCRETYEAENEKQKKEILKYIKERSKGREVDRPEVREISKLDELLELVTDDNKYGL
jgi:broad-specificity NMP kinase